MEILVACVFAFALLGFIGVCYISVFQNSD